jgi:hypothetical protein
MSGLLAGIVAAAGMSVIAMLAAALAGKGWYAPLELAGGLATGSTARFDAGLQGATAAAGAVLHFAIGAGWGALFGSFAGAYIPDLQRRDALWLGASFGIVVWVVDLFVVMPKLDPAAAHAIPLWFGALTHLGYGATLGVLFLRFHSHAPHPPIDLHSPSRP